MEGKKLHYLQIQKKVQPRLLDDLDRDVELEGILQMFKMMMMMMI